MTSKKYTNLFTMFLTFSLMVAAISAHANEGGNEKPTFSFVAGGLGAFNGEGWVTEYGLVAASVRFPITDRFSISPLLGPVGAARTKNIGGLLAVAFDYMVNDWLGLDLIVFAQVDYDSWLKEERGDGWTDYIAAGVGCTFIATEHFAIAPSFTRVWNLEGAYPASWSPGLLFIFTS